LGEAPAQLRKEAERSFLKGNHARYPKGRQGSQDKVKNVQSGLAVLFGLGSVSFRLGGCFRFGLSVSNLVKRFLAASASRRPAG
jgi:hypothetical protein